MFVSLDQQDTGVVNLFWVAADQMAALLGGSGSDKR